MKRTSIVVAIVIVVAAFVAGFWPQHRQLTESRAEAGALQQRLNAAESRLRLADLLGLLLRFSDAVAARNFGDAATFSSRFFDSVRAEIPRTDRDDVRAMLQQVLDNRDRVTTGIAGSDPTLGSVLKEQERALRQALGYEVDR